MYCKLFSILWIPILVRALIDIQVESQLNHQQFNRINETIGEKLEKINDCFLSEYENCNLSQMRTGETYRIFPGEGSTSCINSSPYFFTVIRGTNEKLLYYFQGGGLCFNLDMLEDACCTSNATEESPSGIFNLTNIANPYIHYTIISTIYCSGDLHLGNLNSSFENSNGISVPQIGVQNANSVLTWTKGQQSKNFIKEKLEDLVIAGSSAGALGIQIWARKILSNINYLNSAVLIDSGIDMNPSAFESSLLESYNICNDATLIPVKFQSKCKMFELTSKDLFIDTMAQYPQTVFSFIQSMSDPTLTFFYNIIVYFYGTEYGLSYISSSGFGILANASLSVLNKSPNFVAYLIVPSHHTFLNNNLLYTTNSSSLYGSTLDSAGLLSWLSLLPLKPGDTISTICSGTYCSYPLFPKVVGQSTTFSPTKSPNFRRKPKKINLNSKFTFLK